jgi:hypothetical protein
MSFLLKAFGGLASALLLAVASCAIEPAPAEYSVRIPEGEYPFRFAVLGNTAVGKGRSASQSHMILEIVKDDPAFVLHGGNLVSDGASKEAWIAFDEVMKPLLSRGIPLLPARGWLDVGGGKTEALLQWGLRFRPLGERTWFTMRYKNVMIVVIDSNLPALEALRKDQRGWLERVLADAAGEANVTFIFGVLHHPPYSNVPVTADRAVVERLAPMLESNPKVKVVFSAGAGALERIRYAERWWVGCGGGGGPRSDPMPEADRRFMDLFPGPGKRPFHFWRVTVEETRFTMEAVVMEPDGTTFRVADRIVVGRPPERAD